jgi:T5SS/PEP-CTERM-associated repeat protein
LSTNPAGGSGGAVSVQGSGRAQFERTTFADNRATNFGGAIMQNVNSHVSFRHCVFDTNSTTANGSTGGAMYLTSGAVAYLTDCSFVRNESRGGGGAIHVVNDAGLLADNCKFHGNKCLDGSGGALFLQNLSANPSVDIRNSTIVGNTALGSSADAAAINSGSAFSVFTNCTIVNNESRNGSAVQVNFRGITFVNCLLYGNTSTNATGEAAQTSSGAGGSRSIQYSTIQGWSGSLGGTNNNGLDPMFIRAPSRGPDGFWGTFDDDYGDLRLSSSSPAIDSGDSFAVPADTYDIDNDGNTTEALPLDLDGQSRFYDDPTRSNTGNGTPPIDRGAYENNLATSFWANPLGGRWDTSSNWNGGTPNSAVRAVFDATANAAIVPVTFPSNQSAYSLTIPDRIVNFNMRTSQGSGNLQLFAPGNDLNAPSLLVGQGAGSDATLSINNTGTVFRSVIGTSAVVGGTIGSVGRVAVSGQRSGLELATSLDLGYAGVGLMDVLNRASVDVGSLRLAEGAGGQASLSIAGSGGLESSLLYGAVGSDEVVVGGAGTATVTVSDGGTFAAGDFVDRVVLGRDAGSVGTVVVDGPTSLWASAQDQFVLGDRGTANLSLLNGAQLITSTDSQIVLAREPGSVANITIGDGSNWTEDVQSVVLAGQGTATLNLLPGSSLNFQNNLIINPAGTISGSGTITGGIFNVGTVEVGNSPGTLTINGAYRQLPAVNDPDPSRSRRSGRLELEVGGTSAGQYDQLIVNGPVTLGGGLTVSFANGFTPPSNLNLKLVNPEGQVAAGQFDVAFVPLVPPVTQGGLPRFVRVTQDDGPGGDNGIFIGVGEVPRPYEPQAPQGEQFDGRPVVAAVGDFDGVNGPDLAVAVPGATPAANGTVVVFRNAGTSNGSWNGYEDVVTLVPIGPEPVDMVAVDMDGRLRDDLVVATRGDMSVRVLLNDGGASAFALRQQIATGVAPTTVAAAVLFEDGEPQSLPDIVVGLDALASNVYFLEGNDSGFAPLWVAPSVPSTTIPIRPRVVRPTGTDGDKRVNLLIAGEGSGGPQSSGGVSVIRNDTGEPVSSWDQFNVPVGINPVGMAVGDLNGDGLADAVVANAGDGSISVVLNRTNMIGPVDLAPAVSLPIVGAGGAISIALGDLDGDRPGPGDPFQDLDIAVIAGSAGGGSGTSVYTLRNDTDPSLGGAVTLTQPVPLATTTQDPLLVVTANVDESISNTDDVIGLSESGGGFLPLDNIVARPTPPDVVGLSCDSIDFNNDASFFDPTDIEAFLSVFSEGPCIPDTATCSDIDFNNDGALFDPCDIDSFLLVFSEGPCTLCGQ